MSHLSWPDALVVIVALLVSAVVSLAILMPARTFTQTARRPAKPAPVEPEPEAGPTEQR